MSYLSATSIADLRSAIDGFKSLSAGKSDEVKDLIARMTAVMTISQSLLENLNKSLMTKTIEAASAQIELNQTKKLLDSAEHKILDDLRYEFGGGTQQLVVCVECLDTGDADGWWDPVNKRFICGACDPMMED